METEEKISGATDHSETRKRKYSSCDISPKKKKKNNLLTNELKEEVCKPAQPNLHKKKKNGKEMSTDDLINEACALEHHETPREKKKKKKRELLNDELINNECKSEEEESKNKSEKSSMLAEETLISGLEENLDESHKKERQKKKKNNLHSSAENGSQFNHDDSTKNLKRKKKEKQLCEDNLTGSNDNINEADLQAADLFESNLCSADKSDAEKMEPVISTKFKSLKPLVSSQTMKAIQSLGFKNMTEVQMKAIPLLLEGRDLRATAKTGSGKTLAFLIPALERLVRLNFKPSHGTGVLILTPTRELALQTHSVLQELMSHYPPLTCGVVMGGTDRIQEILMLARGCTILVGTPGRVLSHLKKTRKLSLARLVCFIMDEVDQILDSPFREAMMDILLRLPKERQTLMFSATKTPRSNSLAKEALKADFEELDLTGKKDALTVDHLKQYYVVCGSELRFLFLYKFLKQRQQQKVMVFFSCSAQVQFYEDLLNYFSIPVLGLHGKKAQAERSRVFRQFCGAAAAALLCTDIAARGWDVPAVDWILQFDPPDDPGEYLHRVGRTARGAQQGAALLLLREHELAFVPLLMDTRVNITRMVMMDMKKAEQLQHKLEEVVEGVEYLKVLARKAFRGCVVAYSKLKRKDVYNIYELDVRKVAQSLGMSHPPVMYLPIEYKRAKARQQQRAIEEGLWPEDVNA